MRQAQRLRYHMAPVPADLLRQAERLGAASYPAWSAARKAANYSAWAPYLQRWVDNLSAQAALIDPDKPPYDVLLELNAPGLTMARLDQVFDQVQGWGGPLTRVLQAGGGPQLGSVSPFSPAALPRCPARCAPLTARLPDHPLPCRSSAACCRCGRSCCAPATWATPAG